MMATFMITFLSRDLYSSSVHTPSWAIFGAALQWGRNGATDSAEETADQVLSVIVAGLDGSVSLAPHIP
jgi:hypothetical protein